MAINATAVWEGRTDGAATNGGGYDAAISGAGTDYSLSTAATLTVTDGAITAGTAALSSVTGGFTSSMIGNAIYESGDPTQRYFITAVADTNNCTLDRNVTTGGTGLTVKVGGAISEINKLVDTSSSCYPVSGNDVYLYYTGSPLDTATAMTTRGGGSNRLFRVKGYDDAGKRNMHERPTNKPTIRATGASNSINAGGSQGALYIDIIFDANSKNAQLWSTFGNVHAHLRCEYINIGNSGPNGVLCIECKGTGTSTYTVFSSCICYGCKATLTGNGIAFNSCRGMHNRAIGPNTSNGTGFLCSTEFTAHNVAYNLLKGFDLNGSTNVGLLINNVASTCGTGYSDATGRCHLFFSNAYYNCTTGVGSNILSSFLFERDGTQGSQIALSADPFTNAAGDDFTLNDVANGGDLLRSLGYYLVADSSAVGYPDIGMYQHQDSAAVPGYSRSRVR